MKQAVDFCVAVSGQHLEMYVPVFFKRLFTYNDVENVNFHIILKGVSPEIFAYIHELVFTNPSISINVYHESEYFPIIRGPKKEVVTWFGTDTAETCEYMAKFCGTNDWVIISHLDVLFYKDYITTLRSYFQDDVGMVGEHRCGVCAFHREAWRQSPVGFHIVSDLIATPHEQSNQYHYDVRNGHDMRIKDKSIRVYGFDVMELFQVAIQQCGWRFVYLDESVRLPNYSHFIQGSNYNNNIDTAEQHKQMLQHQLDILGIQKIR